MYRKVLGVVLLSSIMACAEEPAQEVGLVDEAEVPEQPAATNVAGEGQQARASFINGQGTEIGTGQLVQRPDGVAITVDLAFLQAGERGFHIHETGSCEPPTFESAGDHLNPDNQSHGFDHPQGPHAGDLRNLEVETDDGTARGTRVNDRVTLAEGQPNSLLDADGSALVVHAQPDDYETQPSGGSGDPIACAVIEPV